MLVEFLAVDSIDATTTYEVELKLIGSVMVDAGESVPFEFFPHCL